MKRVIFILLITFFVSFGALAKTLEQKKVELKKIYEAGGISKIEYNKAQEFLENSEEKTKKKKLKQTFNLSKNKKTKVESIFNQYKDKKAKEEKITLEKIEELGQIIKFDKTYYTEGMTKFFSKGCNSFKCEGQDAGKFLSKVFGRSKEWGQRNPGQMIKAMAMFEVFYSSKLWYARKSIQRYKKDNYEGGKLIFKEKDEKEIRSLFGVNKGRISMREALGMNSDTPTKETIKKFWLLGEFLDLGTGVDNKKLDKDLKKRKKLLEDYKFQIANLKKKLKDDAEKKEVEKSIE